MKERKELKIIIIDDLSSKIEWILGYLFNQDIMKIETFSSMIPALMYIIENHNDISGIILDLGFCSSDDIDDYNQYKGLELARELSRRKINIPILINSSTDLLPEDKLPSIYGQIFESYDKETLENFIQMLLE